ncbi:GMC oxidoreductase [Tunturibacter empetritectus]|uniref:Choline dehydrogenase-like flavoprotein n=1 Tax=Tunturiibacter lichenicola TaxID=2051959 RepID=A0A7W8J9U6_9BACT|nr:GMC family oxidoreductase [Edaphobacter lichenicola]MBB5345293.1 choline dehydrogenase-like flavoprotein [Edaphobacter lichenicola]
MILTGNPSGEMLESDVCIVGGGPAAISVALELLKKKVSILLLVGGGANRESASDQDLNRGVIARPGSHESLEENRRRVFGGASSAWGGRCIPFDPLDFKARDWITESGWPFSYEEMEPFYRRALTLCRAGRYDFDSREVFPAESGEIIPGMKNEDLEDWHLERWSPPIDFAKEFQAVLSDAANVRVVLNTHALEFVSTDRKDRIDLVRAISQGKRFEVRAKTFVLATGGIENARILLSSRSGFHPAGVGNERDLVGRFYQAHPHGTYTSLAPVNRQAIKYDYERDSDGVYCRRRWTISEEAQARLRINNIVFFLDRTNAAHGHRDAIFSAVFVAKAALAVMRAHGFSKRRSKLKALAPDVRQHLAIVASDGLASLPRLVKLGRARAAKDRRLPSVLPSVKSKYLGLYYQGEQVPNRDSRITLSPDQFDEHGVPRAVVDLAFTAQDIRTVVEAHRIFVERYRAAGAGELIFDEGELADYVRRRFEQFNSAAHHIGTTRMATSREHGVVDESCKVHGVENLYVAGSSVFPTGGHANPTLTIVALALRLGEHLAGLT